MSKFTQLREQYPVFNYKSFNFQIENKKLQINFNFKVEPNISFSPQLSILNIDPERVNSLDQKILKKLIFSLGMVEMISYWKATCSPLITVQSEHLSNQQIAWWHDLFIKGLGEFYFQNQINFTKKGFLEIKANVTQEKPMTPLVKENKTKSVPGYLIPIGGGKDSALTLGLLDKNKIAYDCLLLEPLSPAAEKISQISNCHQIIKVQRQLDPKLLELNSLGFLNGHTPFSAYLAFLSILVAYIFGHQQILVANERSANEGNVEFLGQVTNHQYSKSFEFENKFRDYTKDILQDNNLQYLSFLRPLYELQIAKAFASFPQFFSIFKSCNVGQKEEMWCHHCPKCLFVFVMLSPFIDQETLSRKIFQSNLFTDDSLINTALELIGSGEHKPFECVGTHEETLLAFHLAIKKYQANGQDLPQMLTTIQKTILSQEKNLDQRADKLFKSWNKNHNLSKNLVKIVKQIL